MLLTPGYLLADKYKVVRLAERGGMALLYEVRHEELALPLALKVLMATQHSDPVQTSYFLDEARALAQLRHPGVPTIVDLGTLQGHPYFLMEWLEGETLAARLKRLGRMELAAVLSTCQQIGSVLIASHRLGIVHRDLKLHNIFLCQRPQLPEVVKVLDFGVARVPAVTHAPRAHTVPGTLLGTPDFMPPEQARGDMAAIGPHTDQYALGMLAYAMLVGQPAFVLRDQSPEALIQHLARVQTEAPLPLGDHVGASVSAAVLRALSKQPADRFASVQDFLTALTAGKDLDTDAPTRSGSLAALTAEAAPQPPHPAAQPPRRAASKDLTEGSPPWPTFATAAACLIVGFVSGYRARPATQSVAIAPPAYRADTTANKVVATAQSPTLAALPVATPLAAPTPKRPAASPPTVTLAVFDLGADANADADPFAAIAPPTAGTSTVGSILAEPSASPTSKPSVSPAATPVTATPQPKTVPTVAALRILGPSLTLAQQQIFADAAVDSHICTQGRTLSLRPDRDWLKVQIPWPPHLPYQQVDSFLTLSHQRWLEQPVAQPPPAWVNIECPK